MTPSRPAPSKRRNQSDATLESWVAGVRWIGGAAEESSDSSSRRRVSNGSPRRSRSAFAEQVEEDDGCRACSATEVSPARRPDGCGAAARRSRARRRGDHDLAIEHAALRQLCAQRLEQLGKVAVQRLFVAALDQDFVAVAEDERAKAIPLGSKIQSSAGRQFVDSLGEHRQDGRVDRKMHGLYPPGSALRTTACRRTASPWRPPKST